MATFKVLISLYLLYFSGIFFQMSEMAPIFAAADSTSLVVVDELARRKFLIFLKLNLKSGAFDSLHSVGAAD